MATINIEIDTVGIGVDEDKPSQFILSAHQDFRESNFEVKREDAPKVIYPTRKYTLTLTGLEPDEGFGTSESDETFATTGFICSMFPEQSGRPGESWVSLNLKDADSPLGAGSVAFGNLSLSEEDAANFRFGQKVAIHLTPVEE